MANTPIATPANVDALLKEAQWLRRLAVHLVKDPDEAADVVQETWIAAWRTAPDTERPVRGWLGRVAQNVARRRARAQGRRDRHETAAGAEADAPIPAADGVLERMQLQRIVAERVMALEEPLRSAVCLHYYDGLTSAQVGQALGEPEGTIRWRLKEARERLRVDLDRRCKGRQAWAAVLAPSAWAAKGGAGKAVGGSLVGKGTAGAALVGLLVVAGLLVRAQRQGPSEDARRYAWTAPRAASLKVFGAPAPAPGGALAGLVKEADGKPAAGVVVTARLRGGRAASTAVSTAEGAFAFAALAEGAYDVTAASATALSASAGPVNVRTAAPVRDLVLTLGSGGFLLSGRVLDGGGGAVASASVQARAGNVTFTASADSQGRYSLRLGKAAYRLEADADGYAPRPGSVDLVGDMVRDFRLDPAGRLVGVVVDGPSGKPVAGAIVRAESEGRPPTITHTTSNELGRFSFGDLLPGEYVVSARAGARVGFRSGHLAVPVAGEADAGSVLLAAAFEIAGRVVSADGKPVAGATLYVDDNLFDKGAYGGMSVATSDADGHYLIEGVAPGRFRVRAGGSLPWAPSAGAVVEVKEASVRRDFTLPVGGRLQGQVVGPDGSHVAGATVMVTVRDSDAIDSPFRGNGRADTDRDGRFTIAGLGAGRLQIEVNDKRWGHLQDYTKQLVASQTLEATLTFPAPASVAGAVTWDAGGPAAGVRVRWIAFDRGGGREPEAITDQGGRFNLVPCSPGPGEVQAELPTERRMTGGPRGPHKRLLELTNGATVAGIELVLARDDKTLAGVVLDPEGRPVADATVGVEPDHGQTGGAVEHRPENAVRSDPQGRFLLEHLTRGRYVLWATHAEYPAADRPGTEAGGSGIRLQFAAGATLAGAVKDARGAAVRTFTLTLIGAESIGHTNGQGTGWRIGREEKVNDAAGAFAIERVAPGTYDLLVASPDGRVTRAGGITLAAGERRRNLALVLGPAATLRGKVVDSETGSPLEGARVVVMGTREHVHATSDATGAFLLTEQIPGRTLRVQVMVLRGYIPSVREIPVPGDRALVDLHPFRLMPDPRQRPATGRDDRPFGDTGLRLSDREDGMVVEEVIPGTPAARQGLKAGDRITAVAGRDVSGMGPFAASLLLRGPVGSSIEVAVAGPSGPRIVAIERATVPAMASAW